MTDFVAERVMAGKPVPGVIAVKQNLAIGYAIEDILILLECNFESEWQNRIHYIPI